MLLINVIEELDKLNIHTTCNTFTENEFADYKEIIVYSYVPLGLSNRFRVDIKVVAVSLLRCLEIKKKIEDRFIGIGDRVKVKPFTSIKIGSGTSFDDPDIDATHLNFSLYFVAHRGDSNDCNS